MYQTVTGRNTIILEENCVFFFGYYAASSGNFLLKFRDNYRSQNVGNKLPLLTA
jgi:hypothetical protein